MIINRSAIKQEARSIIGVNTLWLQMFAAFFLVQLPISIGSGFSGMGSSIMNILNQSDDVGSAAGAAMAGLAAFGSMIQMAVAILTIPFTVALGGYFLACLRNTQKPEVIYPYKYGKQYYGKFLGTGILQGLVIFLWSLLFIIPGIVMGYAYLMTPYVICDNPELSPSQALDISKRMTKGYKGDLFVMHLSFILWFLAVPFTFGLILIYLNPYMQTVQAMYYENLKFNAIQTGTVSPAEFGGYPQPEAPVDNSQYYYQPQQSQPTYQAPAQPYEPYQPDYTAQTQTNGYATYNPADNSYRTPDGVDHSTQITPGFMGSAPVEAQPEDASAPVDGSDITEE